MAVDAALISPLMPPIYGQASPGEPPGHAAGAAILLRSRDPTKHEGAQAGWQSVAVCLAQADYFHEEQLAPGRSRRGLEPSRLSHQLAEVQQRLAWPIGMHDTDILMSQGLVPGVQHSQPMSVAPPNRGCGKLEPSLRLLCSIDMEQTSQSSVKWR